MTVNMDARSGEGKKVSRAGRHVGENRECIKSECVPIQRIGERMEWKAPQKKRSGRPRRRVDNGSRGPIARDYRKERRESRRDMEREQSCAAGQLDGDRVHIALHEIEDGDGHGMARDENLVGCR
jgi:hypothetical protein